MHPGLELAAIELIVELVFEQSNVVDGIEVEYHAGRVHLEVEDVMTEMARVCRPPGVVLHNQRSVVRGFPMIDDTVDANLPITLPTAEGAFDERT